MDKEKLLRFINLSISFLVIALSSNGFGYMGKSLTSFYLSISILTLFFVNLYRRWKDFSFKDFYKNINKLFALFIFIISLILSFCYPFNSVYPLISILLLFLGLDLLTKPREETTIVLTFTSLYIIFLIFLNANSSVWYITNSFSYTISSIVTSLTGKCSIIGYSLSGFLVFAPAMLISLIISLYSKKSKTTYIYPLLIIFIWIIYIIVLGFISFKDNSDTVKPLPVLFLFLLPILFFQTYKSRLKLKSWINKSRQSKSLLIFFITFFSILILLISSYSTGITSGKKILFYGENMLGSWDVPEYGRYEESATGMFGLLPYYLKTYGYNCSIFVKNITKFLEKNQPTDENITRFVNLTDYVDFIEGRKITREVLRSFDVFVVINLNTTFSEDEKKSIWGFVKDGGSLLILGDHTNVDNIMTSLNDLLKSRGISYRFDSALPLDSINRWLTCYNKMKKPINFGIYNNEIEIGVGASLDISPPAFPVIIGDFAFSDYGDIKNAKKAFLGDYKYNKGEKLGDVVLVAGCYYNKGRVLVFGDTTTFQNPSLPTSYRFISRVFDWLVNENKPEIDLAKQLISATLILFALFLLFKTSNIRVVPFALLLAIILSTFINSFLIVDPNPEGPLMYIDTSHAERFSIEPFNKNSVTGIMINFARNGYLPIILREFNYEKISKGSIMLIIAPNKAFEKNEVKELMRFVKDGGLLILSSGYQCRDCVKLLLDKFKLDIEDLPLGPVPYVEENPEEYQMEPKFVDVWPILVMNETAISYYDLYIENETYTLITFIKYGKGGFILIADNKFLLDENIESLESLWPGNIQFIKNIIDDVRGRGILR